MPIGFSQEEQSATKSQQNPFAVSPVMGPEAYASLGTSFTEKVPPSFDGHSSYRLYRQDVELWLYLTSLGKKNQGPALIGRMSGEPKASAKSLPTKDPISEEGAINILEHLDRAYGIDETDQLDLDLAHFLDFHWEKHIPIETFIAGFQSRLDKISELNLNSKLQGHLLLRQSNLNNTAKSMILGASSGQYDVTKVANALRQTYRVSQDQDESQPNHNLVRNDRFKDRGAKYNGSYTRDSSDKFEKQEELKPPTFSTFTSKHPNFIIVLVDSGACGSVVGKSTLDKSMEELQLTDLEDCKIMQKTHRFGTSNNDYRTLFAVVFLFYCETTSVKGAKFLIRFDVIDGNLPFLIGLPTLEAMEAVIFCKQKHITVKLNDKITYLKMAKIDSHLHLNAHSEKTKSFYTLKASNPSTHTTIIEDFDPKLLKKLHLQLRHGSYSAMEEWLKTAKKCNPNLSDGIRSLIEECTCIVANQVQPHAVASATPPSVRKQESVAIDIVYIEGIPCLHIVDKVTRWSEACILKNKSMKEQISQFLKLQCPRHGDPKFIYADEEYLNKDFKAFCNDISSKFVPISANDHEGNGSIESANKILKLFFRRLRSADKKATVEDLLSDALFGENICRGGKGVSSFEVLYERSPPILPGIETETKSMQNMAASTARASLNRLMRANVRKSPNVKRGDNVFFWRDKERWLGPAKVIEIQGSQVKVIHNERTKNTDMSRIKLAQPPLDIPVEELEESDSDIENQNNLRAQKELEFERNSSTSNEEYIPPWIHPKSFKYSYYHWENCISKFTLESISDTKVNTYTSNKIGQAEKSNAYDNWISKKAMVKIRKREVPKDANIVGSHVAYRRKQDGSVKGRICPWGNKDRDKELLRCDLPTMNLNCFRFLISIIVENQWEIGEMDVTAAYLQAKGFNRDTYVRPPKESEDTECIWKLTAAAYGIADSGRLRYLTNNLALNKSGLSKPRYEPTVHYKKDMDGQLIFFSVCQVDNYFYTGVPEQMNEFEQYLRNEFDIGELKRGKFETYGCDLVQLEDKSIIVTQREKIQDLPKIDITQKRSSSGNMPVTKAELKQFQSAVSFGLFLGRVSYPVLCRITSEMASKAPILQVHHLKMWNSLAKYAKENVPTITFKNTPKGANFTFDAYSDASLPQKGETKSREGWIIFRRFGDVTHPIAWQSKKTNRVARSSSAAEILSGASAIDTTIYLHEFGKEIGVQNGIEFSTDSRSLYSLGANEKEPIEQRLKIDLASIRQAFNEGIIEKLYGVLGTTMWRMHSPRTIVRRLLFYQIFCSMELITVIQTAKSNSRKRGE